MAESGEDLIRPRITPEEVTAVLDKLFGLSQVTLNQLNGYDDLNYHCLPKRCNNPFVGTLWPHGYVLKIINALDSKKDELSEGQNDMLLFLREKNIPCPLPVKNLYGKYYAKQKFPVKATDGEIQKERIVRLLEYQPGTVLKDVPKSYLLLYQLGVFTAKLNEVLKNFSHPVYETHRSIWHLQSVPEVKSSAHIIENPKRRQLFDNVLYAFEREVLSEKDNLEQGMIHGDLNENNILMSKTKNDNWEVSSVLDFGDSHMSCYLFELAIALCYLLLECKKCGLDFVTAGGHFLAGYMIIRPMFVLNYKFLKIAICARFCQSLVLGLKSFSLNPENTYVLSSQQGGWLLLEELWEIPISHLTHTWNSVIESYNIKTQQL